jgi:hypothetical protein
LDKVVRRGPRLPAAALHHDLASVISCCGQRARFGRGLERVKCERPFAVGIRSGRLGLSVEGNGHGFARIRPAPKGDGFFALQNHVIREWRAESKVCGMQRGQRREQQAEDRS